MIEPAAPPAPPANRLNTVSLRLRVIAAVMAVLAVILILLSLAVNAIFVAQSNRNLNTLLAGQAQLARQLARSGAGPQQIVNRVPERRTRCRSEAPAHPEIGRAHV